MDVTPILNKATELGRMIHRTNLYAEYVRLKEEVESDVQARTLMENHLELAREIAMREGRGDHVEDFEKDRLGELVEMILENELLAEYIQARDRYINLLEDVRNCLMEQD